MSRLPTLEEFLFRDKRPTNSYVIEPGFAELYVRKSRRFMKGAMRPVLDIANVVASAPGAGAFTKLSERLLARGFNLYVECVLNPRFERKLLELGYSPSETCKQSFYKLGRTHGE